MPAIPHAHSRQGLPMTPRGPLFKIAAILLAATALTGCKKAMVVDDTDYSRQLPPGAHALRKITDPAQLPDLANAFNGKDADLIAALDRSIAWFARPSTKQFYPINDIQHDQAQASAFAFPELLSTCRTAEEFRAKAYQD